MRDRPKASWMAEQDDWLEASQAALILICLVLGAAVDIAVAIWLLDKFVF